MKPQTTDIFETQEIILDQLRASRVNGFPFFAYTGIKKYVMLGSNELKLECPRNPKRINTIWITYDVGQDLYNVSLRRDSIPVERFEGVFFDQLAEIIANGIGVL